MDAHACPNCGQPIHAQDDICENCGVVLSPNIPLPTFAGSVASTLRAHTAFQLFGVGGDRVAVDLEVLVLAVAAGADQAGAQQLLHVVGDGAF